MVDIKAILAVAAAAFTSPPPSLTIPPLVDRSIEDNLYYITNLTTSFGVAVAAPEGPPRPRQGGQRITAPWLCSLSDREWSARDILECKMNWRRAQRVGKGRKGW